MSNLRVHAIDLETHQRKLVVIPTGLDGAQRELLTVLSNGQTVFQLQSASSYPQLSTLSLNGEKALYGADYLLDNTVLTWLSAVMLSTDDRLEIIYF